MFKNLRKSNYGIENHGINNIADIFWNLTTPRLYEEIIRRREGHITHLGPISVRTGHHTGRSPHDKFIVYEDSCKDKIWWGNENKSFEVEEFNTLFYRLLAYLQGKDIFIQDCYSGTDPKYRVPIRIITEDAWHSLFCRNIFVKPQDSEYIDHIPEFTVINVPNFHAVPELDSTDSETFILINFAKRLVLIGGTSYAGEIKKAIFTIMNYFLPDKNVFPMHSSVNVGQHGDPAIFFGLSGTGKTTLSADPDRILIGDDEHGWSDDGIFNLEGGCYAKVIRLSPENEPFIYQTTETFGTVLENVSFDNTSRLINLNDASLTENTRAAYPVTHIPTCDQSGMCGDPKNIILLTCDAFGVMPPISRLNMNQALYHFLSGYTAKVAGTEKGLGKEPQATFSACYGAPFMALPPHVYAELLGAKMVKHSVNCWLINTGWTGGPYGVGHRIDLKHTRSMVRAALSGKLDHVETKKDLIFGMQTPASCPDVPAEILTPSATWSDQKAYHESARKLASLFRENFKQFEADTPASIREAGPIL